MIKPDGKTAAICGDGKCEGGEDAKNCASDCGGTKTNQTKPPIDNKTNQTKPPVNNQTKPTSNQTIELNQTTLSGNLSAYEDSPFGFTPSGVYSTPTTSTNGDFSFAHDIGVRWNRGMNYIFWDLVDPNSNGHYNFKIIGSNGAGNYDQEIKESVENLHLLENIATFKPYTNIDQNQAYINFVKAAVERYDGDDNLGCTIANPNPDCYVAGDNQYPSQDLISLLRNNPVKYWQVGNMVGENNDFSDMQRATYNAVKSVDSGAKVLIGGDGGDYATILDELNRQYIDIFDVHHFSNVTGGYLLDWGAIQPGNKLSYYRSLLDSNGYSNVPIWITETGTYSGKADSAKDAYSLQTEQQQAG
ncbi:MAG: hypothetical protein AAB875_03420, partial [Patescibacteria group bacterium]